MISTARIAEIQALEKRGDEIDRELNQRLEDAFITPFDREDIHDLTIQLDDVVDGIQAVAETMVIYGVERPTDEARQLAGILADQSDALLSALRKLDGLKDMDDRPHTRPRPRARGRHPVPRGGRAPLPRRARRRSR